MEILVAALVYCIAFYYQFNHPFYIAAVAAISFEVMKDFFTKKRDYFFVKSAGKIAGSFSALFVFYFIDRFIIQFTNSKYF